MKTWYYVGDGQRQRPDRPVKLPVPHQARLTLPENYIADSGLVDACNVALVLGQPLLLNGEPGTGKTQFAFSLSWELGLGPPLKFETKSDSTARDIFYTYDTLRRFQDAQNSESAESATSYITYQALGEAILRANDPACVEKYFPPGFVHYGKTQSIVLIDEIDKAPRDFPNDVLNEIEELYFRIPELGNAKISAGPQFRPIVVITSNSEKDLPDAFLRRCVYYNIPFPDRSRLHYIAEKRLGSFVTGVSEFLDSVLDLFYELRDPANNLRKKPATAELLSWIVTLQHYTSESANPLDKPELIFRTLSSLVKTAEDQKKAREIVERWMTHRR